MDFECLILGAGLSGLACATTLHRQGVRVLVVDQNDSVGGRVRTRKVPGDYLLDEGFQVLLNSYPELAAFADLEKLDLKKFNSGAKIYTGERLETLANPLVHPETLVSSLFQNLITMKDKALTLKLIASCQLQRSDSPLGATPTDQFLKDYGFSESFIEMFWRPFLTGVFLDPQLSMGANYFQFLIRCFSLGQVSVPASGMAALPEQMALSLPPSALRMGQKIKSWSATKVELESGEQLGAKQVICAFDPGSHIKGLDAVPYQSVTTYYFKSAKLDELDWKKWLIVIPRQFGFLTSHMAYGPHQPILSVSVVGPVAQEAETIASEVEKIAGQSLDLTFLEKVSVAKALPALKAEPPGYLQHEGVLYCGDRWTSPSINGALRSGRLAAEAYLGTRKKV